jgi:hypothetical protein
MELEVTGKHTDGAEAGAIAGGNAVGAGLLMEGHIAEARPEWGLTMLLVLDC